LRNDADTPLPAFMGGCPIPHPSWGYGVAWRDLHRLQPLLEVVQQLQQEGLMSTDLLWTFFILVQLHHKWVMTMLMYPGQVVPTVPSPRSWVGRRSTPVSIGSLLMESP
jgi:hypothetical protein